MDKSLTMPPLEVWGGVECTLNRVGDVYHDQLERSGHYNRLQDLDSFAQLKIKAIRLPILWERWGAQADWSWLDSSLERLRSLSIRPIIGLMHHGSGPAGATLTDPNFARDLSSFARRVASRYSWVTDYTPVNEPLTTSRFCALYGHWYPHARDDASFVRALLNQCRATIEAMGAIREIQPLARLIQTEDLAKTHSVPTLAYQAHFENERRWLSFDLITGRVGQDHPLRHFLQESGAGVQELDWFLGNAFHPSVLGVNYYVTSERYLDRRVKNYPGVAAGGNGRHSYVDVEAVRCGRSHGPLRLLMECWRRYRIPMAITEVHLGCTREEQMRWLAELWQAAQSARARGAKICALTGWALLGSYDWNSLVTRIEGEYEPGAFDVRSTPPRFTAIAGMIRQIARGNVPQHPVLANSGWWRGKNSRQGRPILITSASPLGRTFARICELRGLTFILGECEQFNPAAEVALLCQRENPWAVINTFGDGKVDRAELDEFNCFRNNFKVPQRLAQQCEKIQIQFLTFSSDLVFDGEAGRPYRESDSTGPLGVYGRWHESAEKAVLSAHPQALIVRTTPTFGHDREANFYASVIREICSKGRYYACPDALVSPTSLNDLVNTSLDLLLDKESGLWHLANGGCISWFELARQAASYAGVGIHKVRPASPQELGWLAIRPRISALVSERGTLLPTLDKALGRFFQEMKSITAVLAG